MAGRFLSIFVVGTPWGGLRLRVDFRLERGGSPRHAPSECL